MTIASYICTYVYLDSGDQFEMTYKQIFAKLDNQVLAVILPGLCILFLYSYIHNNSQYKFDFAWQAIWTDYHKSVHIYIANTIIIS